MDLRNTVHDILFEFLVSPRFRILQIFGSNRVQVKSLNSVTVVTKISNLGARVIETLSFYQEKILKLPYLFCHLLLLCKQQIEVYQDFILKSFLFNKRFT